MFDVPTVFILGAGASVEYGYPTGEALIQAAAERVRRLSQFCSTRGIDNYVPRFFQKTWNDRTRGTREIASEWQHASALCAELATKLTIVGPLMIDRFLEDNPSLADVGKLAIALVILGCQDDHLSRLRGIISQQQSRLATDWYRYLFDKISERCQSPADLHNNRVTFITFNYDNSLEHELVERILATEKVKSPDAAAKFVGDKVLHIYGSVGDEFGHLTNPTHSNLINRDFAVHNFAPEEPARIAGIVDHIANASRRLKTISSSEKKHNEREIAAAQAAIIEAYNVYFVGYAHHDINNGVLDLGRCLQQHRNMHGHKNLFFCNYRGNKLVARRQAETLAKAKSTLRNYDFGIYDHYSDMGATETFAAHFHLT